MSKALQLASSVPWLIYEPALRTILEIAARAEVDPENLSQWKAEESPPSYELVESRLGDPVQGGIRARVRDNVAILPVRGPIFRYANLFTAYSGGTSISSLGRDLKAILSDNTIKSLLLNIDSPGGEANGIGEFANMIRAAAQEIPITAYVGGMAASAAYWIASAAPEIVVHHTAMVGSIGVVAGFMDTRERDAKAGVKRMEFISSQSPRKRPDPTTESGAADIQELVDRLAAEFVTAVAEGRGVSEETVLSDFGAGGLLVGSDAIDAGMADRIGSFEEVLAGMTGTAAAPKGGITMSETGEYPMADKSTVPAASEQPVISVESIATDHPSIAEHFRSEGFKAGLEKGQKEGAAVARAEGAEVERARIVGIEEKAKGFQGHEDLVATLKADGKTTPLEAADLILAAEREAPARKLAALKADDPGAAAPAAVPSAEGTVPAAPAADESLPVEERAKAKWEQDADLRAEFGTLGAYTGWLKVEEANKPRRA